MTKPKKYKITEKMKATQFKKGQSGNPLGGKLHDKATRALRKLSIESYREVIELVLTNDVKGLRAMITETGVSALQVGIAAAFLKAIKNGDYQVIESIAQRIVGKIPDVLEVTANTVNANLNTTIDKDKLKAALEALEDDV